MKNLYITQLFSQATALDSNYFLIVSVVTVVLTVVSFTTRLVSGAGVVTTAVVSAVLTSSTVFVSPLLQDANDAATTANTNNFFIFVFFSLLFEG